MVKPFHFPNRTRLKTFLQQKIRKEGKKVDALHYVFCSDDYLRRINLQYLKHDTYTDIITFPLSKKGQPLYADIYISIGRVRDNALNIDTRFLQELHRVMFHGALHLCGYKDKTAQQVAKMRDMENLWLALYFRST